MSHVLVAFSLWDKTLKLCYLVWFVQRSMKSRRYNGQRIPKWFLLGILVVNAFVSVLCSAMKIIHPPFVG